MIAYAGALIPLLLVVFVCVCAYLKEVPLFSAFLTGAKSGLHAAMGIVPTLIGIVTAITMLAASGAIDAFANLLRPVCAVVGIPSEILPLALLRPISGSGANSAVIQIFEQHGPDSPVGTLASVLASASETTFYAVTVYFAGRNFTKLRCTVPVSLIGDFLALLLSVLVVRLMG